MNISTSTQIPRPTEIGLVDMIGGYLFKAIFLTFVLSEFELLGNVFIQFSDNEQIIEVGWYRDRDGEY